MTIQIRTIQILMKIFKELYLKIHFEIEKKTCQPEEIIKDYKIKNSKKNLKIKLLEEILYKF